MIWITAFEVMDTKSAFRLYQKVVDNVYKITINVKQFFGTPSSCDSAK